MHVLIVFAHPESQSFNGALLDATVAYLKEEGHEVKISDLYNLKFKTTIDRDDFPSYPKDSRLDVAAASGLGYEAKTLTADVMEEQDKLLWADFVLFQFPLWWFSMPAILKGWVERVYSFKFAYGVGYDEYPRGARYGEGVFEGKRAMLVVTVGGASSDYSPRGINGPIDDILFPINHGIFFYPGFKVLPPFVVYRTDKKKEEDFEVVVEQLKGRLKKINDIEPISYRKQNGGDYTVPELKLRPELGKSNVSGFSLHVSE